MKVLGILIIILIWSGLYLYKLNDVPAGLYVDEALSGYNAYSLLKTGQDEYGKSWPIALRFLGSYTPPLYIYLTVLLVAIWGLKIWVVRLVSTLAVLLLTIIIFIWVRNSDLFKAKNIAYLAALLLLISPWSVLYGRTGYESYLGLALFSLAAYWLWVGIERFPYLLAGSLTLSLSTYTSHMQRYLAPVFFLGWLILFRKQIWHSIKPKQLVLTALLLILTQIPNFYLLSTPAFWVKNDLFFTATIEEQAQKYYSSWPVDTDRLMALGRKFFAQYLTFFSPRSLFFDPDLDLQRSMPDLSVFYPWMVIPYLIGLYWLAKNRRQREAKYILLLAILGPLPAALTKDPFATQRGINFLLPMILIITLGINQLFINFNKLIIGSVLSLLIIWSLVLLWRSYWLFLPQERAQVWGDGFSQLTDFIKQHPHEHLVIDQARIKPAYIELAFFLQTPPLEIQQAVSPKIKDHYYQLTDWQSEYRFANIETRSINWEQDIYQTQILIGDSLAISDEQAKEHYFKLVMEVKDPLGQVIFRGYQTDPVTKCQKTNYVSRHCRT